VKGQPRGATESGRLTRRDLIRRGAIVGGSLLWVAPAVQSLAPRAYAGGGGVGSPVFGCCECRNGAVGKEICNPGLDDIQCTTDGSGQPPGSGPASSASDCRAFCASQSKAYCFHLSSNPNITCVQGSHGRSFCSGD
jgi:hypothetical protein